jgi:hypothetical protein
VEAIVNTPARVIVQEVVVSIVQIVAGITAQVLKALKNTVPEQATFAAICRQTKAGKFRLF